MCGRFVAASDPDDLAALFDVDERRTDDVPASWNVAPTMPVYAISEHRDHRYLVSFQWGLVPTWSDDPKVGSRMINARVESVADKPAYRTALERRRCIIPADGFYEWHTDEGVKTAYYIHRTDGRPLAFAGLWEGWKAPDDTWLRTCTIITGQADDRLSALHPRMPIILPRETWEPWLDREERRRDAAVGLLSQPDTDTLTWHAVSSDVNNVRNDHPGLIAARDRTAEDAHREAQPRLG
jgi:putative SOS response-associated peptidase YedK